MRILLFFIAAVSLVGVSSAGLLDSLRNEAKLSEKVLEKNFVQIMEETVKKETSSWDSKEFSVPQMMGLSGCYITQTQERHQTIGGGMYAYDIGCGGKRFDVSAPSYAEEYTVEKIAFNDLLGPHVILSYTGSSGQKYHLLFGHTKYILEEREGLVIKRGQHFGTIVMEGVTTGPHLHIEKRTRNGSGDYVNIKFEDDSIVNPKSHKLVDQRKNTKLFWGLGFNVKHIVQVIKQMECPSGYSLKSYRDIKQYSIGCGSKSPIQKEGYTITEKQAESLLIAGVESRIKLLKNDIVKFNDNQKAALLSLYYNCPAGYRRIMSKGINKENWTRCNTINGGTVVLDGLTKRRLKEFATFNKNPLEK